MSGVVEREVRTRRSLRGLPDVAVEVSVGPVAASGGGEEAPFDVRRNRLDHRDQARWKQRPASSPHAVAYVVGGLQSRLQLAVAVHGLVHVDHLALTIKVGSGESEKLARP